MERLAAQSLLQSVPMTVGNVTTITLPMTAFEFSTIAFGADHRAPQPTMSLKENKQVANNSKAFKLTFLDGSERTIEAENVTETEEGRLVFLGKVDGESYSSSTIASILASQVMEYGVVQAKDEVTTGAHTYRVVLHNGDFLEVEADKVMYTQGNEKGAGQYTLVTKPRSGDYRTELVIGEPEVHSISRVTDVPTVPAPTKGKKADAVHA
jgi:hypothetical protein